MFVVKIRIKEPVFAQPEISIVGKLLPVKLKYVACEFIVSL